MKTTVNLSDFRDAFHRMGRNSQFSYEALEVLFDYLEECENDTGEEWELDVIAICCDFAENTWQEIESAYVIDMDDLEPDDEERREERVKDYLIDEGVYLGETSSGFVYRQH